MNPADATPARVSTSVDESLVYEFDLEAPFEKVWYALTNPQVLTQWMLPERHEPGADVDLQLAACDPPHYVAYYWRAGDEPQSLVTFELRTAHGGGTRLRLTHERAASIAGPVALLQAA